MSPSDRLFVVRNGQIVAVLLLKSSLLGGILMFLLLYVCARWATNTDPQILRFMLSAAKFKAQYDPAKFRAIAIRRASNA